MFVFLAPKLRDMGWKSLIPLHNPGKRPIQTGWEAYSQSEPTDFEINLWAMRYPDAGIGLVSGPDCVIAVDLDFLDAAKSERALHISRLSALHDGRGCYSLGDEGLHLGRNSRGD